MGTRIGIELSPVACRIVELEGLDVAPGRAPATRVRSYSVLPPSGLETDRRFASLAPWPVAVVLWGVRSDHRQVVVSKGSYEKMRAEALASARAAGVDTSGTIADIAIASTAIKGARRQPVELALANADDVSAAVRPLIEARLRIQSVITPGDALLGLARSRQAFAVPGGIEAYVALDATVTCVALVRDGSLLSARELPWGYEDGFATPAVPPAAEAFARREDLATRLLDELAGFLTTVGSGSEAVAQVSVCGGLPDLRTMTVPLMERLDVEVEALDSLYGIDIDCLPEPAGEFRERAAELKVAWAAAADWRGPINLMRHRRRRHRRVVLARAAVVAGVAAGLGAGWAIEQSQWWQSTAPEPTIARRATPPNLPPTTAPARAAAAPRPQAPAGAVSQPPVTSPNATVAPPTISSPSPPPSPAATPSKAPTPAPTVASARLPSPSVPPPSPAVTASKVPPTVASSSSTSTPIGAPKPQVISAPAAASPPPAPSAPTPGPLVARGTPPAIAAPAAPAPPGTTLRQPPPAAVTKPGLAAPAAARLPPPITPPVTAASPAVSTARPPAPIAPPSVSTARPPASAAPPSASTARPPSSAAPPTATTTTPVRTAPAVAARSPESTAPPSTASTPRPPTFTAPPPAATTTPVAAAPVPTARPSAPAIPAPVVRTPPRDEPAGAPAMVAAPPVIRRAAEPAPVPFDAVLGTILYSPDRRFAIVNGRIVGLGDEVSGARIVDITSTTVLLRDAQGRLRSLTLGGAGRTPAVP